MMKEKILPLTRTEIDELKHVFNSILDAIHPGQPENLDAEIKQFIEDISLRNLAYTFRQDALETLNDSIFDSLVVTEYVFELTVRFFFEIGDDGDFAKRLALTIANCLQIDGPNIGLSIIPESIAENCITHLFTSVKKKSFFSIFIKEPTPKEKLTQVLESNKHLMIVYLLQLV